MKTIGVRIRRVRTAFACCLLVSAAMLGLLATNHADVQTCTPPPPNIISWWPAEGNANDLEGNNNGTLEGSTTFAAGEVGQAFSFNGVNGGGWGEPVNPELSASSPGESLMQRNRADTFSGLIDLWARGGRALRSTLRSPLEMATEIVSLRIPMKS
jgi:hypothetical protein